MNDIYGHIVITDIKTGKIIPNDRTGWNLVAGAFIVGYNWQADCFNEQIGSWNSEFDKNHPNLGDLKDNEEYHQFIIERWQKILDQYNKAMALFGSAKFVIENFKVVMLDGWGHKAEMKLVTK